MKVKVGKNHKDYQNINTKNERKSCLMTKANANVPSQPPVGVMIDPHATYPVTEPSAGHPVSPQVAFRGQRGWGKQDCFTSFSLNIPGA